MGVVVGTCTSTRIFFEEALKNLGWGGGGGGGGEKQALCIGHCSGITINEVQKSSKVTLLLSLPRPNPYQQQST